ncbi:MAG: hypothetical protein K2M64_00825 [Clostridia bacterium]|nr:hypothetical protein [Clostridia bacterium]
MKRFSSIVILFIFVMILALSFAGCGEITCKAKDMSFSVSKSYYYNYFSVDCEFVVYGLPQGLYDLEFVLVLKDIDGNILFDKEFSSSVTVVEGKTEATVSEYFNVQLSMGEDADIINEIVVKDLKVVSQVSTEENRLKPYSIAICVLACVGAAAMIVVFTVLSCLKNNKKSVKESNAEVQQHDNLEIENK